ncbi:unnamed protein product, partial [Arabidopsis halleri]
MTFFSPTRSILKRLPLNDSSAGRSILFSLKTSIMHSFNRESTTRNH